MKKEIQIKALYFHTVYTVLYLVNNIRHYYNNNIILLELYS